MRRYKYLYRLFLQLLLLIIFSTGSLKVFAVEEPYFNELKDTQIVANAHFFVTDEKFLDLSAWNLIDGTIPQKVDNILTFEFNFDQDYNFYKIPASCTINVTITKYNNPNDTSQSFGSETVDLVIHYDTTSGTPYKGIAMWKFTGAYKYKVVVNSITSAEYGSKIPPVFRLKGQTIINRKYLFDDNSTDVSNFQITNTNQFSIFWTAANYPGAEMFDLEWTMVDDSSQYGEAIRSAGGVNGISAALADTIFRNNNTRVTTSATAYTINLAYDAGFILYRIRGVQLRDNDAVRYEGNWNYQGQLLGSGNAGIAGMHINWHEPNLNWQYSMSFAEEGKKKEVISYFDGTLHNRQSVTINNSDRKSIIQETIYDNLGRPSVNILPVPTTDSTIHYFRGFNINSSGSPYSYTDFQTGVNCQISAQPLSTSEGASKYYSRNNPFLGNYYFAKYIPDANKYPFAVTEYTPDQTGRIQRQGGVGDTFQLNTTHTTKYFYGKPNQNELDRLFGSEAGNSSHYLKNMVMDANGQISISYVNANGNTVATSLAGISPANLSGLPSNDVNAQVSDTTNELIHPDDFKRNTADYSLSATTTILAAVTGNYQFSYNIDPLRLEILHGDNNQFKICNTCYYDLLITLKNNCNITIDSINRSAGNVFDTSCNPAAALTGQFSAAIPDIGEYFLTYTLKVSGDALDFFDSVNLVKNTNIKKANYFLREELKNTDFSGCYNNCETCQEDLGLKQDFIDKFRTFYFEDSVTFQAEDSLWAGSLYDTLLASCNALQPLCKKTPCQEKLDLIKADISPGAQYALYNLDALGNYSILEPNISVLSKYPTISWFPDENGQRDSVTTYYNENGEDSIKVPVNQLTLQQFIENWKDSWADSLARFHPEYCYYLWCTVNSNSYEFNDSLNDEDDGATAVLNGWYNRNKFDAILNYDPFFLAGGNGYVFRQQMSDSLRLFSRTLLGLSQPDRNLLQFIDIILYCRNQFNSFDTCHVEDSCRSVNREWNMYRSFYINLKGYFNEKARRNSSNPIFANCTNCFIGSDGLNFVTCTPPPISDFTLSERKLTLEEYELYIKYKNGTDSVTSNVVVVIQYDLSGGGTGVVNVRFKQNQSIDSLLYDITQQSNHRIIAVYCDTLPFVPFTTTNCNYNCPEGYYAPKDKPGMSFWIHHGIPTNPPSGVPSQYGNCRYYTVITVKTGYTSSCQFTNVWVCTYDSACGQPVCNPDPPLLSSCPADSNAVKYIDKHRIFNEYINSSSFINQVLSGNPNQASGQNAAAIAAQGKDFCEAQADSWIQSLSKCSSDTNLLNQLKVQLIAICSAGADSAHLFGASDNYTNASLPYHTFEEAIKGILGPNAINDTCAAELLSMPYPYTKQPVYDNRTIVESDYDICYKLRQFETQYNSSGFSGTLHQYLQQQLGADYRMSATELADLKKSCTSCNGILQNNIEIPIAFEKGARPCLICDSANALFTSFQNKFPGIDSTTPNYEILMVNYFNQYLGFSLSFDDYKDFLDSCKNTGYTFRLCNQSLNPPADTATEDNSCTEGLYATASTNAHNIYVAYIDSVRRDFQEAYLNKCMNVQPQVSMIAKLYEYHYTLYYYDQSGTLVKTIPPEGVRLLTNSEVARVQLGRKYYREDCYQYADELALSQGYIDFAPQPYLALHDSAFSVESYIYFANNASQGIYSQYDATNDKGYQFFIRNDSLVIRLSENADNYLEATCGTIAQKVNLNAFNHVVFERLIDSLNPVKLLINGNNVPLTIINSDSGFVYNGDITSGTDLLIGSLPSGSGSFMGRIKQFRLYKRLMTSSEIRTNAFDNCLTPKDKNALVVWAPVNDGFGSTTKNIIDNTPASLNGSYSWISNRIIIYPHHNLPSTYQYTSLNQVRQQYSPDGDTSHFWYDRLGRLTVSQNSEQLKNNSYSAAKGRYSYTKYDALGRITEVGEKSGAAELSTFNTKDTTALSAWIASGTDKQVTRTIYDEPDENIVTNSFITVNQSYTTSRKRVVASLFSEDGMFTGNVYDNGTHYAYDINGNVKTLWQEIGKMRLLSDNGIKKLDYDYDLVSGKVNKVMYQQGKGDQFFYKYLYDAENRVTGTQSSRDGLVWINDASYSYYLHGPLARTELGQYKVQGIDYAYTLQGWLKGINSAVLNPATDMGNDGNGFSTTYGRVARDAYGFTLGYYNKDFSPIGGTGAGLGLNYGFGNPNATTTGSGLYNGNISNTTLALSKIDTGAVAGYTYGYDQLNRLVKMNRHTPTPGAATWDNSSIIAAYKEQVSYDANGNILTYLRNGANQTGMPLAMDNLAYSYNTGNNQLNHVTDNVAAGNYTEDIDNQAANNYQYDNIGNLKKDVAEGIDTIRWTVYGKINRVVKNTDTLIDYNYDAAGNRVTKAVTPTSGAAGVTFYVRDASGNVMAVYHNTGAGNLQWDEQHLYGSSRLGMLRWGNDIPTDPPNPILASIPDSLLYGSRNYELTNHLGNVLATISDKKIGHELNDTTIDYFNADVVSANDYYPGGMQMPGRKYSQSNSSYRYGFNGQEKSDDVTLGNYTAEFWEYDSRIGRRWNTDPVILTGESPYLVNGGNPIYYTDPLGDFKTKFGAQWNKFWHGGDKVGKNKYDEWYVSTNTSHDGKKGNGKDVLDEVVIGASRYYGKGRDKYSTAKENLLREIEIDNDIMMKGDKSMYQHYDSPEAAGNAALSFTGLLLPNPLLKSATVASNAGKGVGLGDDVASTFRFGKYSKTVLEQPTSLFRYYDDVIAFAPGRFMTNSVSKFKFLDRMTMAIRPKWNNMTKVAEWQFPAGSTLYTGKAAMQFPWIGGKTQYFIPQDILKTAIQIK